MYWSVCAAAGECVWHVVQLILLGMTRIELMPIQECSRFALASKSGLGAPVFHYHLPSIFPHSSLPSILPLKAVDRKTPPGAVH